MVQVRNKNSNDALNRLDKLNKRLNQALEFIKNIEPDQGQQDKLITLQIRPYQIKEENGIDFEMIFSEQIQNKFGRILFRHKDLLTQSKFASKIFEMMQPGKEYNIKFQLLVSDQMDSATCVKRIVDIPNTKAIEFFACAQKSSISDIIEMINQYVDEVLPNLNKILEPVKGARLIHLSALNDSLENFKWVINTGLVELSLKDNAGYDVLYYLLINSYENPQRAVPKLKYLLESCKVNVNQCYLDTNSNTTTTPLYYVLQNPKIDAYQKIELVKLLLACDVNRNNECYYEKDAQGQVQKIWPLYLALTSKTCPVELTKLLLECGADVYKPCYVSNNNYHSKQFTPLYYALTSEIDAVNLTRLLLPLFLEEGGKKQLNMPCYVENMPCYVEAKTFTPLYFALTSTKFSYNLTQLLLNAGSDPNRECSSSKDVKTSPIDLISPDYQLCHLAVMLLDAGAKTDLANNIRLRFLVFLEDLLAEAVQTLFPPAYWYSKYQENQKSIEGSLNALRNKSKDIASKVKGVFSSNSGKLEETPPDSHIISPQPFCIEYDMQKASSEAPNQTNSSVLPSGEKKELSDQLTNSSWWSRALSFSWVKSFRPGKGANAQNVADAVQQQEKKSEKEEEQVSVPAKVSWVGAVLSFFGIGSWWSGKGVNAQNVADAVQHQQNAALPEEKKEEVEEVPVRSSLLTNESFQTKALGKVLANFQSTDTDDNQLHLVGEDAARAIVPYVEPCKFCQLISD